MGKFGGVIGLVDLYCMYNRARGTDLVSPEDLNIACSNINQSSSQFTVKTYASGVKTIQLKSFNETAYYRKISDCIKKNAHSGRGLTATRIAELMGVNVVLMKEHLKMAEEKGVLCTDQSYEGL
jgi:ESCRT-II complex subunit VPS36